MEVPLESNGLNGRKGLKEILPKPGSQWVSKERVPLHRRVEGIESSHVDLDRVESEVRHL